MQSGMYLRVVFIDHRVRRASSSPSFANQCTPCNTLPEAHHSFLVSSVEVKVRLLDAPRPTMVQLPAVVPLT